MSRRIITSTPRLQLVTAIPRDEAYFRYLYCDADMMKHIGGPMDEATAKLRFQKWLGHALAGDDLGVFLIHERATQEIAGVVGLFPSELEEEEVIEIGWAVFPKFQRRGLAFEAAQAATRFGFEQLNLPSVVALPSEDNHPSNRICEKLGMTRVRKLDYPLPHAPELHSVYWRLDRKGD